MSARVPAHGLCKVAAHDGSGALSRGHINDVEHLELAPGMRAVLNEGIKHIRLDLFGGR
jgi:hypothetical protein